MPSAPTAPTFTKHCPCCGTPTEDSKQHCERSEACTWRRCRKCPAVFSAISDAGTWHFNPTSAGRVHGGTTMRCRPPKVAP